MTSVRVSPELWVCMPASSIVTVAAASERERDKGSLNRLLGLPKVVLSAVRPYTNQGTNQSIVDR